MVVCAFYVIVAVLSIIMLKDEKGAILADRTQSELQSGVKSGTEEGKITEVTAETEVWTEEATEKATDIILDAPTEIEKEDVTEEITEAPTETVTVTEALTEEVTAVITEQVTEITEEVTEEKTEEITEEVSEEITEDDELPPVIPRTDGKYYVFETLNEDQKLLMREYGDGSARTVGDLNPHSTGVIIERGDEWSGIFANGRSGYSITSALQIREVSEEEYIEKVEASGGRYGGE